MSDINIIDNKTNVDNVDNFARLPTFAGSALNRCNLPAKILGGQTFQQHPVTLTIDCVAELHVEFFQAIDEISCTDERTLHFRQYMCSAFLLGKSDEAGFTTKNSAKKRDKIDYLRLLRGWMFNPDGVEGAVLKRWVESRFGLLTLNHRGLLNDFNSPGYQRYHEDYVLGLYNTNALESQLDLLYTYCQYELKRRWSDRKHLLLYRGINHIKQHSNLGLLGPNQHQLLLNNLNSFSSDRYAAETFGDVILETRVPVAKILYFPELLIGVLKGEYEYLVIGGVYQSKILR